MADGLVARICLPGSLTVSGRADPGNLTGEIMEESRSNEPTSDSASELRRITDKANQTRQERIDILSRSEKVWQDPRASDADKRRATDNVMTAFAEEKNADLSFEAADPLSYVVHSWPPSETELRILAPNGGDASRFTSLPVPQRASNADMQSMERDQVKAHLPKQSKPIPPTDLISSAVAVKDYSVSRATLRRAVAEKRLRDYRPKGHSPNASLRLSRAEIANIWPKRGQ
jgi:hypothetical protein